jgi:hypothetical protein
MAKKTSFFIKYSLEILIAICCCLLLFSFIAPIVFTQYSGIADFSDTGGIGDTISGTMSPFINIIGVLLTFAAFYVQYQFNKKQREEIEEQKKESIKQLREQKKISDAQYLEQQKQIKEQTIMNKTTSFENALFNMITLHTDNIESLVIEKGVLKKETKKGNQVISYVVENVDTLYSSITSSYPDMSKDQALIISYLCVFYGKSILTNKALVKRYEHIYAPVKVLITDWELADISHFDVCQNGYSVFLSNYFRILFQIYNYIDNAEYLDETLNDRYFYSKIVRASLSMDELILLYYNILSPMGKSWVDKRYVFKYKIIKNIPIGNITTYSPVRWLRTFSNEVIDQDYITNYFEFYADDNS